MGDVMNEYLDVFVEEAEEHIQNINECLLELEKDPSNLDLINQIFRSAHTIKGGARTVGLSHISDLTHHMEDILDYIRNGQIPVTSEIVDMLFECLDALEVMLDEVKSGNTETSVDVNSLIEKIKQLKDKYLSGGSKPAEAPTPKPSEQEPTSEKKEESKGEVSEESEKSAKKEIKRIKLKYKSPKTTVKVKKIIKEKIEIPPEESEEDFEIPENLDEIINGINKSVDIFCNLVDVIEDPDLKILLEKIKEFMKTISEGEVKINKKIFETLKYITKMLEDIASGLEQGKKIGELGINVDEVDNKIKEALESQTSKEPQIKEIEKESEIEEELNHETFDLSEFVDIIREKLDEGYKLYHLKAKVEDECLLKSARLSMVLTRIKNVGEILLSRPTEGELKEQPFEELEVMFLSDKSVDEIQKELENIPEIDYIAISPVDVEFEEEVIEVEEPQEELDTEDIPDAYKVIVTLDEECLLRAVRAYMVIKELKNIGEVIKTNPPIEKILDGDFNGTKFTVYMKLKEGYNVDDIKEHIMNVPEIKDVQIITSKGEVSEHEEKEEAKAQEQQQPQQKSEEKKPEAKPKTDKKEKKKSTQTIRINIEKLDKLMNLVGELVITRANFSQIANKYQLKELNNAINRLSMLINELQEEVMAMRMVPVAYVFNRFPRMVRDTAKALGKEVEFIMEGTDIELDRTVLDELAEPLVHLIRNALDHGIEPPEEREKMGKPRKGTLKLIAQRERDHVNIIVEDDGRGIDPDKIRKKAVEKGLISEEEAKKLSDHEAINLIFLPGFSTAEKVSEVSGRGVGMDVVKTKIESLGGSVVVYSEKGKGTRVVLKLPLTMSIITALLLKLADQVYAIPITSVLDVTVVNRKDVKNIEGTYSIIYRDEIIPVIWLKDFLGMSHLQDKNKEELTIVVIERSEGKIGVVVDEVVGREDIVVKTLTGILKNIPGLAGATILGDGRVALILDLSNA
ncbi:chemotaxis protein CheA [Methanocaldococcus fervens]|uniref:Chemotaxis protein CheA n=1 Tax=Methanocaldococcus fervens (strain DSM 4213 / JCM 15782 / AG86) TaxID=573064 RepID=C7P7C7_METFA|nr:chemotaxis protein CheA [Methanocaldococcus fervens]ACV24459.1 CheA signal transduction histidine kinase [Methanocaldococcus fervens AG86]